MKETTEGVQEDEPETQPSGPKTGVAQQLNFREDTNTDGKKTWNSLFTLNRTATTGMPLSYNPPKIIDGRPVVVLEAPEIAKQTDEWNNALVVYTFGEAPAFSYMNNYIARYWNFVAVPELYNHDAGCYIV
uniref:Putative ovule protein n=1 Tax=Solanum chacoense TaxID=4108 RepID=A0A0V0HCQ1_SOLCH